MKSKDKMNKLVVTSILSLIAFCAISVLLNVFSLEQLPSSFLGAVLGALITVIVTNMLLKNQSESESEAQERKEKNVKVFQEKLPIFQEYIDKLWAVSSEHLVTSDEYEKLVGMNYSKLILFLGNKESIKKISKNLVQIGEFVDKKTYGEEYNIFRNSIIDIINILSDEIDLGGQIDVKTVQELDKKIFPALFKRKIINAFNKSLNTKEGILKDGEWQEWSENKNNTYECMSFLFKDYPGISVKFCFVEKAIHAFLIVPHGSKYNKFSDFRGKGSISQRIVPEPEGWKNLLEQDDDYKEEIVSFNFIEGKNLEIIANKDYYKIIDVLAKRGASFLEETRILTYENGEKKNKTIIEFLEYVNAT
ncbi:MAG: hypothetical protein FWG99_08525 [Treponema sp.]|nr:hypothetical protein [Treponema sp.]